MTSSTGLGIEKLLSEKRAEILSIAEKHGAFNVRVFGSVARGEATEQSDVDFLVDYSSDRISAWFPVGLIHDLENLLGREVDVTTVPALNDRTRERILREAVLLSFI